MKMGRKKGRKKGNRSKNGENILISFPYLANKKVYKKIPLIIDWYCAAGPAAGEDQGAMH